MVSHSVVALSGTKSLQPVALALTIYTISLRLACNTYFIQVSTHFPLRMISSFPQEHPTLSRFLHAVPLLGILCMASVEVILHVHPVLALVILLLSAMPLIAAIVRHGRRWIQLAPVVLPIRMRDTTTSMSRSSDGVAEAGRCDIC